MRALRGRLSSGLGLVVVLALLHAAAYIALGRSEWSDPTVFSDQLEYEAIAHAVISEGRYTTYPGVEPYVAEGKRPPGYPLFVAAVHWLIAPSRLAVTAVHAVLFALLCALVYDLGAVLRGRGFGLAVGAATALYAPLPHSGAYVLSMVVAGVATILVLRLILPIPAVPSTSRLALAGVLCGYMVLVRPSFILLPLALVAWFAVGRRFGRAVPARGVVAFLLATALLIAPWTVYTYHYFGTVSPAPAGRVWRDLWAGTWHGTWRGRVESQMSAALKASRSDAELVERLGRIGPDVERMHRVLVEDLELQLAIQANADPQARIAAHIAAERDYRALALRRISEDPLGFVWRRATHGVFILWASHVPLPYRMIDNLSPSWLSAIWVMQAAILVFALMGAVAMWRVQAVEALLLSLFVAYVAVVHFPLRPDPRWALPVMPVVLLFAVAGGAAAWRWMSDILVTPRSLPSTT